jgi:2-polyprenyl-6-methoxyphenol hydroxylase-like FAD-dependent oxidoreductase
LGEAVLARAGRIEEARWLGSDGRLYRKFTLPDSGAPAVALRRADLQAALRGALPAGTLRLGKTLAGFEEVGGEVRARFADGGEVVCDLLVGADGLHSRVRAQAFGGAEPVYRGYNVWRGVARLEDEALPAGTALEVYGEGRRFGVGPLGLGRTGWWATANEPEGTPEAPAEHARKLSRLFEGWPRPVPELIAATPTESILRNAAYDRPAAGVTLLGDAVHPMTPNLGQGGCQAIEDAAVLARCVARYEEPARALREYESRRRARAERVARYSRLYGAFGQLEGRAASRLRARLLSSVPESLGRRLLSLVFDYDAYGVEV